MHSLGVLNEQLQENYIVTLKNIQTKTIWVLVITLVVFITIGALVASFLSKFIIYPINKLIKSSEIITQEETKGKKKLKTKKEKFNNEKKN